MVTVPIALCDDTLGKGRQIYGMALETLNSIWLAEVRSILRVSFAEAHLLTYMWFMPTLVCGCSSADVLGVTF